MPARTKTTTPDAAQKRLWKSEIRTLETAARKVGKDVQKAFNRSLKEADAAVKSANAIHRKHLAFAEKLIKSEIRETAEISRRIAILKGRMAI